MPRYRRVHAAIDACLPSLTTTQATKLALLVSAILVRRTLCLSELARAWPRPARRACLHPNTTSPTPQAPVALHRQPARGPRRGPDRAGPSHHRPARHAPLAGLGHRLDHVRRNSARRRPHRRPAGPLPGAAHRRAPPRPRAAAAGGRLRPRQPPRRPQPKPARRTSTGRRPRRATGRRAPGDPGRPRLCPRQPPGVAPGPPGRLCGPHRPGHLNHRARRALLEARPRAPGPRVTGLRARGALRALPRAAHDLAINLALSWRGGARPPPHPPPPPPPPPRVPGPR